LEGVLIVICQYDIPTHRANAWKNTLFENISSKRVIIFDSIYDNKFQIDYGTVISPPLLRKIDTTLAKALNEKVICNSLESPNFVEGPAAALLTHCQLYNIPATLYLTLLDVYKLQIESLKVLEKTLALYIPLQVSEQLLTVSYQTIIYGLHYNKPNPLVL